MVARDIIKELIAKEILRKWNDSGKCQICGKPTTSINLFPRCEEHKMREWESK